MAPSNRNVAMVVGIVGLTWLTAGSAGPSASSAEPQAPSATSRTGVAPPVDRALLDRYCVSCHNEKVKTAGLALDSVDATDVGKAVQVWEKVARKLHVGLMPPAGRPRPEASVADTFTAQLEAALDHVAAMRPNPGRTEPLHRLNRTEYRNAIRDMLSLELDVATLLPADDASYGFDNIAAVQRMSPTLMERYLVAAEKISRAAVGIPAPPTSLAVKFPEDLPQDEHVEGLPFGTRGGALIRHAFPLDGEYTIRVQLARLVANTEDIPAFEQPQQLEISVDGARVEVFTLPAVPQPTSKEEEQEALKRAERRTLDANWKVRVPVKAGLRNVAVTFLNRAPALLESPVQPFLRPYPGGERGAGLYTTRKGAYLRSVEIDGPLTTTGPGDTPSRRRVFVCQTPDAPCAKKIVSTLAQRAYRRPVTEADLQALLKFYHDGASKGGHEVGVERALRAILISPEFLFRVERDPATAKHGEVYRVNDLELASRLSFFLWSSIPDDELLGLAIRGQLKDRAVLEKQVLRMLADPRVEALVNNFAGQWLFLRNVPSLAPDPKKDPDFDDNLRAAFRRETELFFGSIIREDRSVLDLLTADYTFVNERLARHYGIPDVYGGQYRRVTVQNPQRYGLLGHGSILSVTSLSTRTSPVVRGKWILTNILGTPPPEPPPNVPELTETTPTGRVLTMRERIAAHRTNPACAGCHAMMEPLGFALENYDFVGRWRAVDETFTAIDATGELPDGTPFDGVSGLRQALLRKPDRFLRTMTEKLLTYALGRGVEAYDMPAVRQIVRDASKQNLRFSSFVMGVINSLPFQARRADTVGSPALAVAHR